MAALHLGCGVVHAWLRSHIDLNEFDGKTLGSKICHGLLSTFAVAGAYQHENVFGGELPGNFPSNSFVRACHECNRFSHSTGMITSLTCRDMDLLATAFGMTVSKLMSRL